jgi:hypothetical protein
LALAATTTGAASQPVNPSQIIIVIPGCIVDPSEILGWWPGEGDVTAAVGPDLGGAASFGPGLIGQGIVLDGATTLTVDGFPEVSTGVTVEAWVRPTETGSIQTILSRWDFPSRDDSARSYGLFLHPGGRLVWSTDETSTRRPEDLVADAPILLSGGFHHVAATWSPTSMALYVNGDLVAQRASQGGVLNPASSTPFRVGSKAGIGNPFFFDGTIDEPRVIGRALSGSEITNIVDAGPNAVCLPPTGPTLTAGPSGAAQGAGARWKGANSGAEIFVGPMLPPSALPRAEAHHLWSPGTSFDITMQYDAPAGTLTATATGSVPTSVVFDFATPGDRGCPATDWDVLDVLVVDSRADAGVRLADLTVDGTLLGDLGTIDVAGTPGAQAWSVTGADFSQSFDATGRIEIDGAGLVGNEAMRVQFTTGCLLP